MSQPNRSPFESLADSSLTLSLIVAPRVIGEIDTPVDRRLEEPNGISLFKSREPKMKTSEPDAGYGFSRLAESAVRHFTPLSGVLFWE